MNEMMWYISLCLYLSCSHLDPPYCPHLERVPEDARHVAQDIDPRPAELRQRDQLEPGYAACALGNRPVIRRERGRSEFSSIKVWEGPLKSTHLFTHLSIHLSTHELMVNHYLAPTRCSTMPTLSPLVLMASRPQRLTATVSG